MLALVLRLYRCELDLDNSSERTCFSLSLFAWKLIEYSFNMSTDKITFLMNW